MKGHIKASGWWHRPSHQLKVSVFEDLEMRLTNEASFSRSNKVLIKARGHLVEAQQDSDNFFIEGDREDVDL